MSWNKNKQTKKLKQVILKDQKKQIVNKQQFSQTTVYIFRKLVFMRNAVAINTIQPKKGNFFETVLLNRNLFDVTESYFT